MQRNSDVDVHSSIVILGYAACFISLTFCVTVVWMPPGPTSLENGALRYISDGLDIFCGWSSVVMGTCSMIILLCQLVAAAFMRDRGNASAWAIMQAVGWNVVAGVSNTGWTMHYFALVFFLVGNLVFNHIVSRDAAYGSRLYRAINTSAIVFALSFSVCVAGTKWMTELAVLQTFAVSLEFVLMFSIVLQTLCLVRALDSYHVIHLRFEHTGST